MASEELIAKVKAADAYLNDAQHKFIKKKINKTEYHNAMETGYPVYLACAKYAIEQENDIAYGLSCTSKAKKCIEFIVRNRTKGGTIFDFIKKADETGRHYKILEQWYDALKIEGPYLFDSYMIYIEKDRDQDRRFYLPKRDVLQKHGIIQGMQDLEDDKIDRLLISMPPGTGKTTTEVFFASWVAGKYPDDFSLFYSHSGNICDMFYRNVSDIITSEEYKWSEIFPDVSVESTNAKKGCINLGDFSQHATIQTTSAGASNSGLYRCNRYLYVDDLIPGIEVALNPEQLEKRWSLYGIDARQRKTSVGHGKNAKTCKEIQIATRWAVRDIIGRTIEIYGKDGRTKVISIPDIDPKSGKSNFEYEINGMSKEFFEDQKKTMDDISYNCLYKQTPIEREGLLFPVDKLRRYTHLPVEEPDAKLAICDTKNKGSDYMAFAFLWKYGQVYYLVDALCSDSSDYGRQYQRSVRKLEDNEIQIARIESNQGGDRFAYSIEQLLQADKYPCKIDCRYTTANKETKIIANADMIIRTILFPDDDIIRPQSDMYVFMNFLVTYSARGKNVHDDVPDALSSFTEWQTEGMRTASVSAVTNPLRSGLPTFGGYGGYGGYDGYGW